MSSFVHIYQALCDIFANTSHNQKLKPNQKSILNRQMCLLLRKRWEMHRRKWHILSLHIYRNYIFRWICRNMISYTIDGQGLLISVHRHTKKIITRSWKETKYHFNRSYFTNIIIKNIKRNRIASYLPLRLYN